MVTKLIDPTISGAVPYDCLDKTQGSGPQWQSNWEIPY